MDAAEGLGIQLLGLDEVADLGVGLVDLGVVER